MKTNLQLLLICILLSGAFGCKKDKDSDALQRQQQEVILAEATAQVGMPAINNFRERKLLKTIYELRDQDGLVTYTYLVAAMDAKLVFLCASIGYPLPAATQFTNPEKPMWGDHGNFTIANADPNGLFSPSSAEASWVLCADPVGGDARVVYVEERLVTSPFRLDAQPPKSDPEQP